MSLSSGVAGHHGVRDGAAQARLRRSQASPTDTVVDARRHLGPCVQRCPVVGADGPDGALVLHDIIRLPFLRTQRA
ncbi:MAG: hypothetical protein QF415_13340, partial [Candidatus Undinarchaeales archaeon]|nr:hypothetical protein [Candidatus Undinarchaeales archaeon]